MLITPVVFLEYDMIARILQTRTPLLTRDIKRKEK